MLTFAAELGLAAPLQAVEDHLAAAGGDLEAAREALQARERAGGGMVDGVGIKPAAVACMQGQVRGLGEDPSIVGEGSSPRLSVAREATQRFARKPKAWLVRLTVAC